MAELFEGQTLLFTIPAIVGGAVFLLRMSLMLIGGIGDVDGDLSIDVDMDVDLDADPDVDAVHADSTEAFKVFSIQTISAFLMGFGVGGLIGLFALDWPFVYAIGAAVAFGTFMVWLITTGMKLVYDLQSSGNIDIRETVGCEAVVYTRVPAEGDGTGSVRVVVGERMRIYRATTEGDAIASQTKVRVTRVNGDNSVTVTAV